MLKSPLELKPIDTIETEDVNAQDIDQSPLTPVTLVTTQAIALLQNVTVNQATQCLNQKSKLSLQKNVEKLSKAAHLAFSKGILQRD